jgi:hypothetical protein
MTEDLDTTLWNPDVTAASYAGDGATYQGAILEQYRMYVEMADRISERRAGANTFFLTLNTSVLTILGAVRAALPADHPSWLAIPLAGLLAECAAWFYLVRSYRQLNSAKYRVVGALEKRLPASPYWSAEWSALGKGQDRSLYWPLTHLEQWVPITFIVVYVASYIAAVSV